MANERMSNERMTTEQVLADVLEATPVFGEVHQAMRMAHDAAWRATQPRLLELARKLVALLLHCDEELHERTPGVDIDDAVVSELPKWPTSPAFNDTERAVLAFTEQFVTDVASLDDDSAANVRKYLGDEGLNDFTKALLVVEQRIRLRLVWGQLLGSVHV